MSDHKPKSGDNDLLSNPREHDHLGLYVEQQQPMVNMKRIAYRLKHAAGVYRDMDDDAAADQCLAYADELLAPRLDDFVALREDNIRLRAELRRYYLKEYDLEVSGDELSAGQEESTDNSPPDTRRETEYRTVDIEDIDVPRPDITMHFYYNDPDSMRRYRLMNKAEDLMLAVQEFDNWLRNRIRYNPDPGAPLHIPDDGIDYLTIAREQFLMRLNDYDINIWED